MSVPMESDSIVVAPTLSAEGVARLMNTDLVVDPSASPSSEFPPYNVADSFPGDSVSDLQDQHVFDNLELPSVSPGDISDDGALRLDELPVFLGNGADAIIPTDLWANAALAI